MIPQIFREVQTLATRFGAKGPVLEVGAAGGEGALVSGPAFESMERHALNMVETKQHVDGVTFHLGNSNDLHSLFPEPYFGTVLSNAVLEHDRYFWRSLEEMRRILLPGGLLIVGVPGFAWNKPGKEHDVSVNGQTMGQATVTYKYHTKWDYWRLSPLAMREVVFEGMEVLSLRPMLKPPRLMGIARKPG